MDPLSTSLRTSLSLFPLPFAFAIARIQPNMTSAILSYSGMVIFEWSWSAFHTVSQSTSRIHESIRAQWRTLQTDTTMTRAWVCLKLLIVTSDKSTIFQIRWYHFCHYIHSLCPQTWVVMDLVDPTWIFLSSHGMFPMVLTGRGILQNIRIFDFCQEISNQMI